MANMLESYDLSCKYDGLTKDYTLKFKVAKGVKVSYSQVGDINKIDLNEDSRLPGGDNSKTYKITGPLKVQFFQNTKESELSKAPINPDPDVLVEP